MNILERLQQAVDKQLPPVWVGAARPTAQKSIVERLEAAAASRDIAPAIASKLRPAGGPKSIVIVYRQGYRWAEKHPIYARLSEAGWEVRIVTGEQLDSALAQKPDVIMRWEEHGCLLVTRAWREIVKRCYEQGTVPMSMDYAYFDHYNAHIMDRYHLEKTPSSIQEQWPGMADEPAWAKADARLQAYRAGLLEQWTKAEPMPGLEPGKYIVAFLQFSTALMRRPFRTVDIAGWAAKLYELFGKRVVFKGGPVGKFRFIVPEGAQLFHHDGKHPDLNTRLLKHCEFAVFGCSTVSNEIVIHDVPAFATANSWFAGLGAFDEPETWEELASRKPRLDAAMRGRWTNWWLTSQCYQESAPQRVDTIWRVAQDSVAAAKMKGATVTCVYAPDAHTEQVTKESLLTTARCAPGWRRIAAIDAGRSELDIWAKAHGCEVIRLPDGQPPRMSRLLEASVRTVPEAERIWVVESDVQPKPGALARLSRVMSEQDAQSVGAVTIDSRGQLNYPITWDLRKGRKIQPGILAMPYNSFCSTLWRAAALRGVDWPKVPPLEGADKTVCKMTSGKHLIVLDAQAEHQPHTSRQARKRLPVQDQSDGKEPMDRASYNEMQRLVTFYLADFWTGNLSVVDVGSRDVNGAYKPIFPPTWKYVGVDLEPGANVDCLMLSEFILPFGDSSADLVISGQTLEHCRNPHALVCDMARILKRNGLMLLVAPREQREHRYPFDCFRFLPDGMRAMMELAGIHVLKTYLIGGLCWGIGKKT